MIIRKDSLPFETTLLKWLLLTLILAILLGGKPWHFPGNGKYLLASLFNREDFPSENPPWTQNQSGLVSQNRKKVTKSKLAHKDSSLVKRPRKRRFRWK